MGPKKRRLLGSALRQSGAYDSFTVGSVCECVCVFISVHPGSTFCTSVFVYIGVCIRVCLVFELMHVLTVVPWHSASVYLGHFLCVQRSQTDRSSTCHPSILLSFLTSSCHPSLYWLNQCVCVCVCVCMCSSCMHVCFSCSTC